MIPTVARKRNRLGPVDPAFRSSGHETGRSSHSNHEDGWLSMDRIIKIPLGLVTIVLLCWIFFFCFRFDSISDMNDHPKSVQRLHHGDLRRRDLEEKQQVCNSNGLGHKKALDLIHVEQHVPRTNEELEDDTDEEEVNGPYNHKVLCFVNTISTHHKTQVRAIYNTWGRRCDKLIFASNATDAELGVVKITSDHDSPHDHDHLWQKHKATMRYIWETYGQEYEWFYKSDDDAYVILENLRAYLNTEAVQVQHRAEQRALQIGHRYALTPEHMEYYILNKTLLYEFRKLPHTEGKWIFNSGGPGVVMNRKFLQTAVDSFDDYYCLNDRTSITLPDDASINFCMAFHEILPINSRDALGRERWHPNHPAGTFNIRLDDPNYWPLRYHEGLGGVQNREECCARSSVAFHYISPPLMYYIERMLYYCRSPALTFEQYQSVQGYPDIQFNAKLMLKPLRARATHKT